MTEHLDFIGRVAIDLVAVGALAFAIYLPRHRRRDCAAALVALNLGLVAVLTALMAMPDVASGGGGLAVGFGLFAVLSIIRLRSEASTFTEVTYFFTALALGVVNGVGLESFTLVVLLDVALVGGLAALEGARRGEAAERQAVVADEVFANRPELVAYLERRLGAKVLELRVAEVDLVRETTAVEVLVSPHAAAPHAVTPLRQLAA